MVDASNEHKICMCMLVDVVHVTTNIKYSVYGEVKFLMYLRRFKFNSYHERIYNLQI